jgi:SAM-dependent methyltransferase
VDSCLEIGCGAGRVTLHLAEVFREVHGLDVSPGMIDYARSRVSRPNVRFHLTDGIRVPLEDRSVTAVLSTFVFQHFDSLDPAAGYFREIARVLRPGGTVLIQLPVHAWPSHAWLYDPLHRAAKWSNGLLASVRTLAMRAGLGNPPMRHQSYDERFLFATLTASGFRRVEIHRFGASESATVLTAVLLAVRV